MRMDIKLLTLFIIITAASIYSQDDLEKLILTPTRLSDTIYMLRGTFGGNIGLSVGPDGIFMIDTSYSNVSEKLKSTLKDLFDKPVKIIVNTHFHGDHVGGNAAFSSESLIISHENVRRKMSEKTTIAGTEREPSPQDALPDLTYTDSMTLHFNGEDIKLLHLPRGHTDGDTIIIFEKSKVIHVGDLQFAGLFPFIDLDNSGDVRGLISNIKKVLRMITPDYKIIPGHGPLSTPDDLKNYLNMLEGTFQIVEKKILAGKSLYEIKKEGLPKEFDSYNWNFITTERWIEILYRGFK